MKPDINIILRRIQQTSESLAEATANVLAFQERLENEIAVPENWAEMWPHTSQTHEEEEVLLRWIVERPPVVRSLLTRFPPLCLVRGRCPLLIPAPGKLAIVIGYQEPSPEHLDGLLIVKPSPTSSFQSYASPDALELAATRGAWTSARIVEVFKRVAVA